MLFILGVHQWVRATVVKDNGIPRQTKRLSIDSVISQRGEFWSMPYRVIV